MGASRQGMANALAGGQFTELRQRILFLIGALLVFRVGSFITVPGIDPQTLTELFQRQEGTILSMFN
jgi:preprotein translocase subunit SecY